MNREDILNSIGLQRIPERTDNILPAMGIFGAGILVGAGLGLLFAPKPGRELRADLAKNAEGLSENIRHRAGDLSENIKHRAEDMRKNLPDVGGMIQTAGDSIKHAINGDSEDDSAQKQVATAKREPRSPQHS